MNDHVTAEDHAAENAGVLEIDLVDLSHARGGKGPDHVTENEGAGRFRPALLYICGQQYIIVVSIFLL